MNKAKKNIVVVGFNQIERNSLGIPYDNPIHYVGSLSDTTKYQGYLILIDNKINKSLIELDKKYRKTFNKFELIWVYNENYDGHRKYYDKWSRIEKVNSNIFNDGYSSSIEWDEYKYNKEHSKERIIKYNTDKKEKLNLLYNYLKKYKTRKTTEIVRDLNIDSRTIQRYMNDLNNIYHNIGYDYSSNEWYFIW